MRQGDIVGYQVTLRGARMNGFLEKLIHITLPRTRDFRGLNATAIDEMGNLTIGVDFVAGAESSLKGEVLFAFPPTVAPIVAASGRNSLGWIFLDGPALPAGVKLTAQMVLKSADKGILIANNSLDVTLKKWFGFKYFPIQQGYNQADLVNITHIGFRITMSPPTAAANWSGVIYADHFQLRK